jgi:pilus assembly protein Flp/PilA
MAFAKLKARLRADARKSPGNGLALILPRSQSAATGAPRRLNMAKLTRFFENESGATAIEYALIASLIAVFIIAGVRTVGTKVSTVFTEVGGALK